VPTTGIVTPGVPSVPWMTTLRSSAGGGGFWPSLKMTAAEAPAACALSAFCRKGHVPRCMSAMLPAVKPAKSAASQPLVDVFAGLVPIGTTTSTGWSAAVASPLPE
jgi:hypothetical protein